MLPLGFLGAKVISVATAEAAAARLGEADVVITDYAHPGHDGVWLLEQIQGLGAPGSSNPRLGVRGEPHPGGRRGTLRPSKLLKPIDPFELGRQIGMVVGREPS